MTPDPRDGVAVAEWLDRHRYAWYRSTREPSDPNPFPFFGWRGRLIRFKGKVQYLHDLGAF